MTSFKPLPWRVAGLFLGLTFLLAVVFVKPIGVSTQFVIADAIVWSAFDDRVIQKNDATKSGYESSNAYLNKSGGKYAKSAAQPLNYSFVFVIAMMFGAFLSSIFKGDKPRAMQRHMPEIWRERFGDTLWKRYVTVFISGFIVLFGARLAGGCTSGHMMSGMMQTSLSGYLFALGAFATGIPTAILLFRTRKGEK
tara:strand:- start:99782 stop:100366 length:585 start_codon:yes stop_codon:yes gene_type:complete